MRTTDWTDDRNGKDGDSLATQQRVFGGGLVGLAVLVFLFLSSYGFTAPFYYGHYGFHGGSYATWARGTLRHHTIYPVNEPGFATPDPHTYYIHHPVLTHQLVTLTFALFGEHEWSVRLAALLPSVAALLLVAAIGWRYLGPLGGGAAALVFAFVPVNIWYGSHIDQGFPSIAFLLAFFLFYLRWLSTGRWGTAAAALFCGAMAGCFEWSPYFAFPAIYAHVLWTGWRRRGRYAWYAALHPLVAIAPLAMHFYLVWRVHLLPDILAAYRTRTAPIIYREFAARMLRYADILFGRVLIIAMVAWLLLVVIRLVRGRGRAVDLVGVTFAFALITYMHVFKDAVVTHAYRQLYGNVWAALAVGDLAISAGALTRRLFASRPRAAPRMALMAAVLMLALISWGTLPTSWAGLMESRLHGGVPDWTVFDPDMRQTAFAMEVERLTTPKDLLYFHPSLPWPPPHRMDWAFYYDRDLRRHTSLRSLAPGTPQERRDGMVILIPGSLAGDELRAFGSLASRHPVFQIQDLAAIDLRSVVPRVTAYRLAPIARPAQRAIRRWLDGPYPTPTLVRDAGLERTLAERIREANSIPVATAKPPAVARPPAPPVAPSPVAPPRTPGSVHSRLAPPTRKPAAVRRR